MKKNENKEERKKKRMSEKNKKERKDKRMRGKESIVHYKSIYKHNHFQDNHINIEKDK